MRLLLDTHIFVWYVTANPRLPPAFKLAIQDGANDALLSMASVWEIVIKHALGKMPLPLPAADYIPRQRQAHGIELLSIDEDTMRSLAALPLLHRDPFDRIMVAQALQHGLTVASVDPLMFTYPIRTPPLA